MFCWVVAITLSGLEPLYIAVVCCFILLLLHIITHSFITCKQRFLLWIYSFFIFLLPGHSVFLFNFVILTFHSFPTCTWCTSASLASSRTCSTRTTWTSFEKHWQICVFVTTLKNICIYWHIFANIEERHKKMPTHHFRCPPVSSSPSSAESCTSKLKKLLKLLICWFYWNCWNYWPCWNYWNCWNYGKCWN